MACELRREQPCHTQRVPADHLDDLRAQAKHARERYRLYKAKTHGQRPTSPARLRELQRAYEQAEERLRFAEAEANPARDVGESRLERTAAGDRAADLIDRRDVGASDDLDLGRWFDEGGSSGSDAE
jgi:hypothetical protein